MISSDYHLQWKGHKTEVHYYHIESENEVEAIDSIRKFVENQDPFIKAKRVDTIKRRPVIDYGLHLSPEGEVLL